MNNGLKYALIFLGGALFGGLAQAALRRSNINLKPMAADLLSRGMDGNFLVYPRYSVRGL